MKRTTILLSILLLFSFSLALGQQPGPRYDPNKGKERAHIDGVIRVFMHQPDDYSVMTKENGEFKVYRIVKWISWLYAEKNIGTWFKWEFEQRLQESKDGKMSVVVREYPEGSLAAHSSGRKVITTIYITSEKAIDGAGWEEGSRRWRREGNTTVIR